MNTIAHRMSRSALRSGSVSTYRYILYAVNAVLLVSMVVVMEWDRQGHESVRKRMDQYHLTTVTRAVAIKEEITVVEDALIARALETLSPDAMANSELFLPTYPGVAASLYLAESELGKIVETQSVFRGLEYEELVPRTKQQFFDLNVILSGGLYQRSEVETAQRQLTALTLSLEQLRRLHRSEHAELTKALPGQDRLRHGTLIGVVIGLLLISHVATRQILKFIDTTDALQESEERYRAVAEDMPVLICRFLPGGEITYVNDAYCKRFEKSADELVGSNFLSLIPEADREAVIANIAALMAESPTLSHEHQVIAPGGELRWQRWTNRALFDGEGTAVAYQSIGEDITEQKQAKEQLRLSAEIAEHLVEGINLIRIDDGIIVYTNDRFDEMFGYGQGELIGQHVAVLNAAGETSPEETVTEMIHGVAKNGSWHGEIHNVKKDRTEFWCHVNVSTFEHSKHGPVFLTVQEDITERKAATAALFQSEKRLRDILDSLFGFVGLYTTDGVLIEANRAPLEAAGLKKEEVIGKPFWETYWWSYSPEVQEQLKEALRRAANGETVRYDIPVRVADDRLVEIDVMFGPLFDSEGNISQLLGFGVDITERKRAERALRLQAMIIDQIHDSVVSTDLEGFVTSWNKGAERLLGYTHEEMLGKHIATVYPEDEHAFLQDKVIAPLKVKGKQAVEVRMRRKSGETFHAHLSLSMLHDDHGNTTGMIGYSLDITERKRAEEEKRKLQDQLRHAQKMDAVGQLAAGVAHEFNNILVGILGNAELLLAAPGDDLPERFKRPLKDIERSGTRAADLTKQLLSFTRKKNPNISLCDVNQVITDSKGMLRRLVGESITLKTVLAPDPALVRADEAEIEQAILNLVMNARDAMPNGGTLAIQTDFTRLKANEVAPDCKPGRYVRLSVIDDGCGMPPEVAERIFEPFFTTKPVGEGTGLGLSTIFADVTNSGGFVKVESRVGEGTVIRVHFPEAEGTIETTGAGAEDGSTPIGGNETILVCDDEEIVLASVVALLQTLGYSVVCANSPREAMEAAAAHDGPISLLLTDVTMPGMDGIELGKEIMRFYPDIKVVLTSGYAEDVLQGRAGENGHFRFLQKPVPYDILARTFREVLD